MSKEEDGEKEDLKNRDSLGWIEYWRSRSATYNTLFQQLSMPEVKNILNIMDGQEMTRFNMEYEKFKKKHSEAKDFVKFLTTLERQFKNINNGDLQVILENIQNLLNGLKLIWTISRHINNNDEKMGYLLQCITNEICDKVKDKIQLKQIFKIPPKDAMSMIDQASQVLREWEEQYAKTRASMQGKMKTWDYPFHSLFSKPKHMRVVLEKIYLACKKYLDFNNILGSDLRAVTGDAARIDSVKTQVEECIKKLETFSYDAFDATNEQSWETTYQSFDHDCDQIVTDTNNVIDDTFKDNLKSSESAFVLLQRFKMIETDAQIKENMNSKYEDVMLQYDKELTTLEDLYSSNIDNPPIAKNMPPQAGAIAWARSIFERVKGPIQKFDKREGMLKSQTGHDVSLKYFKFARKLEEDYEDKIYNNWKNQNTDEAIRLLKDPIIENKASSKTSKRQFFVNFSPKLKVIIREAKYLDRIGKDIPKTIINIALQEKEYLSHVDKLNLLLGEYDNATGNLKPVERKLLEKQIGDLNAWMDKGVKNHNWFSLSINAYIKDCQKAIDKFNEIKSRVLQQANNIEKNVKKIEDAQLIKDIDWSRAEPMDYTEFFEAHKGGKIVNELVASYKMIGDTYLKNIEETTVKSKTQGAPEMWPYYRYWEHRIFNAIRIMILRAMSAVLTIYTTQCGKTQQSKLDQNKQPPPLIKVTAHYNHPEITYRPSKEELGTQLEKFSKSVLDTAKQFGRWWKGYCICFNEKVKDGETYIPFTFFDDVNESPIIADVSRRIVQAQQEILKKIQSTGMRWKDKIEKKGIHDKHKMSKIQKHIEKKNPSAGFIEREIVQMIKTQTEFDQTLPTESLAYFISIDQTEVKIKVKEKIEEWIAMLGEGLTNMALKELNAITRDIQEYNKDLEGDPSSIEELKGVLNKITEMRDRSMEMEFRISDVQEQFRILKMYNYDIDEETSQIALHLDKEWEDLVLKADQTDFDMEGTKKSFADFTEKDVLTFKETLKKVHAEYVANGPAAEHIGLQEGLQKLEDYKAQVAGFNKDKEEKVRAEKLFDLPISKYDELIAMEVMNAKLDLIYDIYKEHVNQVKEWSMKPWSKLDIKDLTDGAEKFEKQVKRLPNKHASKEIDKLKPYHNLKETVIGFKDSVPLIEKLKIPAI